MAEVGLQGSGIVSFVGQCEAASVTQHVRMYLERHPGFHPSPLHHPREPGSVNGPARSLVNTKGHLGCCSRCNRRKARKDLLMDIGTEELSHL